MWEAPFPVFNFHFPKRKKYRIWVGSPRWCWKSSFFSVHCPAWCFLLSLLFFSFYFVAFTGLQQRVGFGIIFFDAAEYHIFLVLLLLIIFSHFTIYPFQVSVFFWNVFIVYLYTQRIPSYTLSFRFFLGFYPFQAKAVFFWLIPTGLSFLCFFVGLVQGLK